MSISRVGFEEILSNAGNREERKIIIIKDRRTYMNFPIIHLGGIP